MKFSILLYHAVIFFCCTSLSVISYAGTITFIIDKLPPEHPQGSSVYMGGTINDWASDNPHYKFKLNNNGQLYLRVPFQSKGDTFQFKLTRGSWERVELNSQRHSIANRTYTFKGGHYREHISVGHWADLVEKVAKPSTLTGKLEVLDKQFKYQNEYRTVRVLLPSNYQQNNSQRFPVLYMFDGQNLFDQSTASVGMEWKLDETVNTMVENKQSAGVIVVGIDSAPFCQRMKEYTGWQWQNKLCGEIVGEGAFYSAFLVNQVKPYIDKHYRTRVAREYTYLGGSSLGGYMSIYTAVTYQNTFSKVIGISNAVIDEYTGAQLRNYILKVKRQNSVSFYLDIGDQEVVSQSDRSDHLIQGNQQLYQTLVDAGFVRQNVTFKVIKGGVHDENSWAKRLPNILAFMGI